MNARSFPSVPHIAVRSFRYATGALMALGLLAGCGGSGSGATTTTTTTTTTTNTVNALSVVNGPTISGGSSCSSTLTLRNPNTESYTFTYRFDGLDISGRQIATIVFSNTVLGNHQQSFLGTWQALFAQNTATACTSLSSVKLNTATSSPVTTTAIRSATSDSLARFSGVWSTEGATTAWAFSIDDRGAIFGQSGVGCILTGAIGQDTGIDGIRRVALRRNLCGHGDETFEGVVLVDAERPSELHLWSHDAQQRQFNLAASR